MIGSLFTGISGLNANTRAMSVIGDNIANVNTPGFKKARPSFANILSQSLNGSPSDQIGRGVTLAGVTALWNSGSVENTTNNTDLSINGEGLFIVNDSVGASYYTRAGEFSFDKDGNLVNPDGLFVQGYQLSSTGALGAIGNITLPPGTTPAQATSTFSFGINLDASAASGDQYSTSIRIYDSLGNDIPLTITFTKTANPNEWDWEATVPTALVGAGNEVVGNATMTFNADGTLPNGVDPTISIPLTNGAAAPLNLTWDLYDTAGVTNGDLVQYASASATTSVFQDGHSSGTLQSVSVDEQGIFSAVYTNGTMTPFFQITLADFPSYPGLTKIGSNLYAETVASGPPMMNVPGGSGLGTISPNSLEMSNVDLAEEFVKMITTQRAFQANSRVITTSDEILAELMNIKR